MHSLTYTAATHTRTPTYLLSLSLSFFSPLLLQTKTPTRDPQDKTDRDDEFLQRVAQAQRHGTAAVDLLAAYLDHQEPKLAQALYGHARRPA